MKRLLIILGLLFVAGVAIAGLLYKTFPVQMTTYGGMAILPFMLYQLAGFGTMHFIVPKPVNWIINIGIPSLIIASYAAYREGAYVVERRFAGALVVAMVITVFYGVLKLRKMQATYDAHRPPKDSK